MMSIERMEASAQVIAGMGTADLEIFNESIRAIFTSNMPREMRVRTAVAAMRGYVQHHTAPTPEALAWIRKFGDVVVIVTKEGFRE